MSALIEPLKAHFEANAPKPPRVKLQPLTARQFLELELPPRENILAPWLPTKGLAMVYAPRGVGKTHLSLGVAYHVAAGVNFLGWTTPKPRRVLFVDGEMPGHTLQKRLAEIAARTDAEPADDFFRILASDLTETGIPDLATAAGQEVLSEYLGDADLVILDNLSTLCRSGKENEAESWVKVQEFLLTLRREGRSVLLIHHAGKGGDQRGTSKREDVLDTVIKLSNPDDYEPGQGARFNVTFEKSRGFMGKDAEPFEAWLDPETGVWRVQSMHDAKDETIIELLAEGLSLAKIGQAVGLDKSNVSRRINRMKAEGRIA